MMGLALMICSKKPVSIHDSYYKNKEDIRPIFDIDLTDN